MRAKPPVLNLETGSLHREMIGRLPKPYWLHNGELLDDVWTLRTSDPNERLGGDRTIDFKQSLTCWPSNKYLTDPEFEHELVSAKLYVYYSLYPAPIGWNSTAGSAKEEFENYMLLLRWKVDRGIVSSSALNSSWFREFDDSFERGGREGLLRLSARVPVLIQAFQTEAIPVPRSEHRKVAAPDSVARLLGVQWGTQLTDTARRSFLEYFASKNFKFGRAASAHSLSVPKQETFREERVCAIYGTWFRLWHLRPQLTHDPIGYRAFKTERDIRKRARAWSTPSERTEDAPEYQTCFLANGALKVITSKLVDDLCEIVEEGLDDAGRPQDQDRFDGINKRLVGMGLSPISPIYRRGGREGQSEEPDIYEFCMRYLPAMCRSVMAIFSARRDEEVGTCKKGCIEPDQQSNNWLNCLIVKNVGRYDRIPVPRSVARAVAILERIHGWGSRGGNFLFKLVCPRSGRNLDFKFSKWLPIIARFLKIPALQDGTFWKFKPHQFRKFFGVTYFWRWAFPNLTALTFQYRHFNPETTRGYIELKAAESLRMRDEKLAEAQRSSDAGRKADFDSGKVMFVRWVVKEAANGTPLGGSAGRKIQAQVDEIMRKALAELHPLASPTNGPSFDKVLNELIGDLSLNPHPEGHSLCACGNTPADRDLSKCLELKQRMTGVAARANTGPDSAYASDENCLVCAHRAALPSMTTYWDGAIAEVEEAAAYASEAQKMMLNERARRIREHAYS
jgi:hypothetical protein